MKRTTIYFLLLVMFATGCQSKKSKVIESTKKDSTEYICTYKESPCWKKKVKEADSLSKYGYGDLYFDEYDWYCFEKMGINYPREVDTIFYTRNEGCPLELKWSFSVYKYGLDSVKYRKYVEAVSRRHANGFYPSYH